MTDKAHAGDSARPLVVGIGGTTRTPSSTDRALRIALKAADEAGARTHLFDGPFLARLPHYVPEHPERNDEQRQLVEIVREADGRGHPTTLTPRVLAHFGVTRPEELLQTVYRQDFKPAAVAALATHVQQARDEGDAVATAILDWGARELVGAAESVTKQLELGGEEFSFVLAGGMFKAVPWLGQEVTRLLPTIAPRSVTALLDAEPAFGAVRLALAELHGGAKLPIYKR